MEDHKDSDPWSDYDTWFLDLDQFVEEPEKPLYTKEMAIAVSVAAVDFVARLTDVQCDLLKQSDFLTPVESMVTTYEGRFDEFHVDGIEMNPVDIITHFAKVDKNCLRMYVEEFGVPLSTDPEEALRLSRCVRYAYPSGNKISRRVQQMDTGSEGTTQEKFYFPSLLERKIVFYGATQGSLCIHGWKNVLCCYDTNTPKSEDLADTRKFFRKANIKNWKKHKETSQSEGICSDVSLGEEDPMGGFYFPEFLVETYQAMYDAKEFIVIKWYLQKPCPFNVMGFNKVSPHNMEIILWCEKGSVPRIPSDLLESAYLDVPDANRARNNMILNRRYEFVPPQPPDYDLLLTVDKRSLYDSRKVTWRKSKYGGLTLSQYNKRFKKRCVSRKPPTPEQYQRFVDQYYRNPFRKVGKLDVDLTPPIALMDKYVTCGSEVLKDEDVLLDYLMVSAIESGHELKHDPEVGIYIM